MAGIISRNIEHNEILVRYIFDRNFKKKRIEAAKFDERNVFLPYKGGVSLQRHAFVSESSCKKIAKTVSGRIYVGFVIFRKSVFENVKSDYIKYSREDFKVEIRATPLDKNLEIIPEEKIVYSGSFGQPAHADIRYIDPAPTEDETPKTAIRSFSRKLAKKCCLVIDSTPTDKGYHGIAFSELI